MLIIVNNSPAMTLPFVYSQPDVIQHCYCIYCDL